MKRYIKSSEDMENTFYIVGWKSNSQDDADLYKAFDSFQAAKAYAENLKQYYRCDVCKSSENTRICQYRYGREVR